MTINSTSVSVSSEIPKTPNKTIKSPGFYTQLAYDTANCAKRLGLGVAAAGIEIPLTMGAVSIAQISGYVPDIPLEAFCHAAPLIRRLFGKVAIGVIIPIGEEILFRGLLQDVLLRQLPKYIVKKIQPDKDIALDTKIAKAARIVLTATLFVAAHMPNNKIFLEPYVKAEVVTNFVGGICLSLLRESSSGLLSVIGMHSAHNLVSIAYILNKC